MKSTLILAAALLSLSLSAPLAHASRTPNVPKSGRVVRPAGRGQSPQPAPRGQLAEPAGRGQVAQPAASAPVPVPAFDPSPFREGVPPPPVVAVTHRNFPRGTPEWDTKAASHVRLKRAKHAVKVLQARIYTASQASPGQRANALFEGRLSGSENEDFDQNNVAGYTYPPERISDVNWARQELWTFIWEWKAFEWKGAGGSAKAQVYARLFDTIKWGIGALSAGKLYPGLELAVSQALYADELILWFGAWLPHLDDTAAWLMQARSNPQAPPTPLGLLAALMPTFFSPLDALCASSTVSAELLVVVDARLRLIPKNKFLWAGGVDIPALKSEAALDAAFRILSRYLRGEGAEPTLAQTQQQLCEAEEAPLLTILSYRPQQSTKSARKV